ncbi:hypothetical protein [Nonomuraea angiospora]|nr:hypothetical protein [Nonomuraea angiospora]MDX3107871.1 hypothetical protein [Nonomuraea angiospora]
MITTTRAAARPPIVTRALLAGMATVMALAGAFVPRARRVPSALVGP